MPEHHDRRWRYIAKAAPVLIAVLILGGILIHWSWNTVAGDLFQAPGMKFRHAVAAEVLIGVVAAIGALSARVFSRSRGHGNEVTRQ